jgi:polyphosphate glucokinase
VLTAPNLGTRKWKGFALQDALSERFGKPARLQNDAEVAGLGVIQGKGLEVVITLGTGFGSAIFSDGRMSPHLELAHHPIHKSLTYDEYVGDAALKEVGRKKWKRRVLKVIAVLRTLLNFDKLHIGGGNARLLDFKLPRNVDLVSNDKGIIGGVRLWDDRLWHVR